MPRKKNKVDPITARVQRIVDLHGKLVEGGVETGIVNFLDSFIATMEKRLPSLTEIKSDGPMTVQEAGRRGGRKVHATFGHEFYVEIGKKGGHKVRDLIAAGKKQAEKEKSNAPTE